MVPWSHLRQPFLGWVMTVLTAEFTHFNSVIRLSKAKQSAFLFCTILRCPAVSAVPWDPSVLLLYWVKPCRTSETLVYFRSPSLWQATCSMYDKATGMSFSCRCGLFGIWWGETYCASNSREFVSRYMPLWLTGTRAWIGTTHDL